MWSLVYNSTNFTPAHWTLNILVLGCVSLLCWYYWTYHRILAVAWHLPTCMPTVPLLGHGYLLLFSLGDFSQYLTQHIKKLVSKSISLATIWMGPVPLFIIANPNDMQIVLNNRTSIDRISEANVLKFALGNGVLTAPANIWKITRRYIGPLFSPRNLQKLMPMMNMCGRDLTRSLSRHVGQGLVDIYNDSFTITVKAAAHLIFGPGGLDSYTLQDYHRYQTVSQRISKLVATRLLRIWLRINPVFHLWYWKDIEFIRKTQKEFFEAPLKFIEEQKKQDSQDSTFSVHDKDNDSTIKNDCTPQLTLADIYKALQKIYPDLASKENFVYEVNTFMHTGADSASLIVPSCLMCLASNHEIQERLYNEIESVMEYGIDEVTLADLKAMPYLDQVVKESLRLFTVVPNTARLLQEDLKLSQCTLPAGSNVNISLVGLHFDPKLYPNPEKFDPERFSPENEEKREKGAFLPFSAGTRNCIGKHFALMLIKTLLVHVVRKYKLSTSMDVGKHRYLIAASLVPLDGYYLELQPRVK